MYIPYVFSMESRFSIENMYFLFQNLSRVFLKRNYLGPFSVISSTPLISGLLNIFITKKQDLSNPVCGSVSYLRQQIIKDSRVFCKF